MIERNKAEKLLFKCSTAGIITYLPQFINVNQNIHIISKN